MNDFLYRTDRFAARNGDPEEERLLDEGVLPPQVVEGAPSGSTEAPPSANLEVKPATDSERKRQAWVRSFVALTLGGVLPDNAGKLGDGEKAQTPLKTPGTKGGSGKTPTKPESRETTALTLQSLRQKFASREQKPGEADPFMITNRLLGIAKMNLKKRKEALDNLAEIIGCKPEEAQNLFEDFIRRYSYVIPYKQVSFSHLKRDESGKEVQETEITAIKKTPNEVEADRDNIVQQITESERPADEFELYMLASWGETGKKTMKELAGAGLVLERETILSGSKKARPANHLAPRMRFLVNRGQEINLNSIQLYELLTTQKGELVAAFPPDWPNEWAEAVLNGDFDDIFFDNGKLRFTPDQIVKVLQEITKRGGTLEITKKFLKTFFIRSLAYFFEFADVFFTYIKTDSIEEFFIKSKTFLAFVVSHEETIEKTPLQNVAVLLRNIDLLVELDDIDKKTLLACLETYPETRIVAILERQYWTPEKSFTGERTRVYKGAHVLGSGKIGTVSDGFCSVVKASGEVQIIEAAIKNIEVMVSERKGSQGNAMRRKFFIENEIARSAEVQALYDQLNLDGHVPKLIAIQKEEGDVVEQYCIVSENIGGLKNEAMDMEKAMSKKITDPETGEEYLQYNESTMWGKIIPSALESIEAFHKTGLVHLDLKPAQILVLPNGRAVLIDFGSARNEQEFRQMTLGICAPLGHVYPIDGSITSETLGHYLENDSVASIFRHNGFNFFYDKDKKFFGGPSPHYVNPYVALDVIQGKLPGRCIDYAAVAIMLQDLAFDEENKVAHPNPEVQARLREIIEKLKKPTAETNLQEAIQFLRNAYPQN